MRKSPNSKSLMLVSTVMKRPVAERNKVKSYNGKKFRVRKCDGESQTSESLPLEHQVVKIVPAKIHK